MDLVHLGLTSTLHIHASGALTYCAPGEWSDWDEDAPRKRAEAFPVRPRAF